MFRNKPQMLMPIGKGIAPMSLEFFCFAAETLEYLALTPIAATKLQGFSTDKVVVTLATVAKSDDLCHGLSKYQEDTGTIAPNLVCSNL
jgi:hypothetical protein